MKLSNRWKLGIVYNGDGKVKNHRSLLKVVVNPFLRTKGIQIATKFDKKTQALGTPMITKCPVKKLEFSFDYKLDSCDRVEHRRTII